MHMSQIVVLLGSIYVLVFHLIIYACAVAKSISIYFCAQIGTRNISKCSFVSTANMRNHKACLLVSAKRRSPDYILSRSAEATKSTKLTLIWKFSTKWTYFKTISKSNPFLWSLSRWRYPTWSSSILTGATLSPAWHWRTPPVTGAAG
jgi:hypothetical protein